MSQTNLSYYYRPTKTSNGRILKCAGHGAERPEHLKFYLSYFNSNLEEFGGGHYLPGVQVLEGYRGDRIDAQTHEEATAILHKVLL